jgi:hypothetical protein
MVRAQTADSAKALTERNGTESDGRFGFFMTVSFAEMGRMLTITFSTLELYTRFLADFQR